MTMAIRWRFMSLQAILFLVIAGASGFTFVQGSFVTNQVHDQLAAQQIYFPAADQVKTGGALDPAEFPQEIRDQAGNQVLDGNQARIYANDFIGIHLEKVANGKTYSQVSSDAIALNAQLAKTAKTDPSYASMQTQLTTLNGQKATLFQGEMLKATLLNSYGWWQFGVYMTYAAFGLAIVALGVLGALVFEVVVAARKPKTVKVAQQKTATA
jgi:hypothetical protein